MTFYEIALNYAEAMPFQTGLKPGSFGYFGEVSVSVVFFRHNGSFSDSLGTQSDFPWERYFLAPGGLQGGKKWGQNSPLPIK